MTEHAEDAGPQQIRVQTWVQPPSGHGFTLEGQELALLDTQSLPSNVYGVDPSQRPFGDEGRTAYA